jgi:hypothetical protein
MHAPESATLITVVAHSSSSSSIGFSIGDMTDWPHTLKHRPQPMQLS